MKSANYEVCFDCMYSSDWYFYPSMSVPVLSNTWCESFAEFNATINTIHLCTIPMVLSRIQLCNLTVFLGCLYSIPILKKYIAQSLLVSVLQPAEGIYTLDDCFLPWFHSSCKDFTECWGKDWPSEQGKFCRLWVWHGERYTYYQWDVPQGNGPKVWYPHSYA